MRQTAPASLTRLNTFGIEANAEQLVEIENRDELPQWFAQNPKTSFLALGGGSNVVFTQPFRGAVVKQLTDKVERVYEEREFVLIKADAGKIWHDLVMETVTEGLGGLENLSLIPGCVGAAPIQNIGAYGVELKDVFDSLEAFLPETGEFKTFYAQDCAFGYRDSVFKRELRGKAIITSVTLCLQRYPKIKTDYGAIAQELASLKEPPYTIRDVSEAVIRIRQSKLPDPKVLGNAGSFFKNPVVSQDLAERLTAQFPTIPKYPVGDGKVKLAAGWLIEQAGLKGKRYDDLPNVGVHAAQALVLVNLSGATGANVLELSRRVQAEVFDRFGVNLECEAQIV